MLHIINFIEKKREQRISRAQIVNFIILMPFAVHIYFVVIPIYARAVSNTAI